MPISKVGWAKEPQRRAHQLNVMCNHGGHVAGAPLPTLLWVLFHTRFILKDHK